MAKYRALRDLWYPTDARIIRRLRDGEEIPMHHRHLKKVIAGEIVDDIPNVSVKGLLANGWIEEVSDAG